MEADPLSHFPIQKGEQLGRKFHRRSLNSLECEILNCLHTDKATTHHHGPAGFLILEVTEDPVSVF